MATKKKQKKQKRQSRATNSDENAQKYPGGHAEEEESEEEEAEEQAEEQANEQATPGNDEDVDMDLEELDSDFEKLSDDERPTAKMRRHNKPKMDNWAKQIMQDFVVKKDDEMRREFQSQRPDFPKIEKIFRKVNHNIQNANKEHNASPSRNLIPRETYEKYRNAYNAWSAYVRSDRVKDNPGEGWKAYDLLRQTFRLTNREYDFPKDWNISHNETQRLFGERPENMEEPPDTDADSAAEYSAESESEVSDSDEPDGIDGLESRMRKKYSSLSRGKVLYWWPVGTGTQVFVRYGSKRNPIFRVRAGSSQPYDQRAVERVLNITPGNRKGYRKTNGMTEEFWENSRDDVLDIVGVGWKVDDDDGVGTNALASIRPIRDTIYPHTRVLVKWKKNGQTSLERRGFVRRIASGNKINGDRMIYLKAKELENAYWGYDVEEDSDNDFDDGHSSRSEESSRRNKVVHFVESDREGSDADLVTSQSGLDPAQTSRQSRKHISGGKPKLSNEDIETKILLLTEEMNRLNAELGRGGRDQTTPRRNRRRRRHN